MLQNRIKYLVQLKNYLESKSDALMNVIELAERANGWFTQEFQHIALHSITDKYLNPEYLIPFSETIQTKKASQTTVGIVMAGNIPLVGFHDFLCTYLFGYPVHIKLSAKDDVLMKHIILKLQEFDQEARNSLSIKTMLQQCDAYIATGSNTSAAVFKQYFGKYPHIIRDNKTSVAVLDGSESKEELEKLADDVYLYFGLGCRNVTKLYVPKDYDFVPLLGAFRKYDELKHHNKYRNNYDYQLALYILNNQLYMSNESILLIEKESIYSPISVLHYEFYDDNTKLNEELVSTPKIQCIVGKNFIPFGHSQSPSISQFADGVNTIDFLNSL